MPPEIPNAPATGTVELVGDARQVVLELEGQRWPPGAVPPGTYVIRADFGDGSLRRGGSVVVAPGDSLTVECVSTFRRCAVR